jgi:hypothetical protein
MDIYEHPQTWSLIKALDYDSISTEENGIVLYFRDRKSIGLTLAQLKMMNNPKWIEPYKKPHEEFTKAEVLTALAAEFGK